MEKKYRDKLINDELIIMDEIDRLCKEENLEYFLTAGSLLGAIRHGGVIPWDDDIDIAMPRKDFDKLVNESYKKLDDRFYLDYSNTNKKYFKSFAKIRIKNTVFKEPYISKDIKWGIWVDIFVLDNMDIKYIEIIKKNKKKIELLNYILAKKFVVKFRDNKKIKNKIFFLICKLLPRRLIVKRRNKLLTKYNNDNNRYFINYGSKYSAEKQIHEISKYYPTNYIKFENRKYKVPNDIDYVLKKIYGDNYMKLPPKKDRVSHNPLYIKYSDGEVVDFTK